MTYKELKFKFKNINLTFLFYLLKVLKSKKIIFNSFGINFIGYHSNEFGLGIALKQTILATKFVQIPFVVKDQKLKITHLQSTLSKTKNLDYLTSSHLPHSLNCILINPDLFYRLPYHLNWRQFSCKYNIGYWFWELSNFPKSWKYASNYIDEIWVSSDFNLNAMKQAHQNVFKIPLAVNIDSDLTKFNPRKYYIPNDTFKFFFSFDLLSSINRKNPQGIISAFLKAFPDKSINVTLIIKTSNSKFFPIELAKFKKLSEIDRRIIFINEHLPTEEMNSLTNFIDSYVSLHRSEGFGLGIAEAMLLGKPVIATAYSGNLEFMNSQNSFLVPYQLRPLKKDEYIDTSSQYWAEPDIQIASQIMRSVFENKGLRDSIGQNAKKYIELNHSSLVMGKAIFNRLMEVQKKLSKTS